MKTATRKPAVKIGGMVGVPHMLVNLGEQNPRGNVLLLLEKSSRRLRGGASVFLTCELGTRDREPCLRWHATVDPRQIDNLISCLTVARANLRKIGVAR